MGPLKVAVLVVAAGAATAVARQSATFRSAVETVAVYATVRDRDGNFIPSLTREDFEVRDNGKRQDITAFSSDLQPTTIALLLDRSGSLKDQMTAVTNAAGAFVRDLLPEDRASISTLFWNCQPMTADKAALLGTLGGPLPGDMGSPIWPAVERTAFALGREPGRRALLLFSDGQNIASFGLNAVVFNRPKGPCRAANVDSEVSLSQASDDAAREGLLVYAISVEPANHDDLERLAKRSGGRTFALRHDGDLTFAYLSILDELHHQYLLGFVPSAWDGRTHKLDVTVRRPGATVRSRRDYLADRSKSGATGLRAAALGGLSAPLTADEVERAIQRGAAGEKLQAICSVKVPRGGAGGSNSTMQVIAEGPIGRIMHAARDAKDQNRPFTATDVSAELKANTLRLTVQGSVYPTNVRLRDSGDYPTTVLPAVFTSPSFRQRTRDTTAVFDLADFDSLSGPVVNVLLSFMDAERQCTLPTSDVLAIR